MFMVLFTLDPVGPSWWFGPCAIVLFATALVFIPVMTTVIQVGRKVGVRATEWIVILMLVASSVADANHAVRLLPEALVQDQRPDVPSAYAAWRGQAPPVEWPGASDDLRRHRRRGLESRVLVGRGDVATGSDVRR